jgi:hypothetical protein
MRHALVPSLLAALAACASPPRVVVAPTGRVIPLAPRASECPIAFFRAPPADRAFDEVAVLTYEGRPDDSAAAAEEGLRREACALGADAVVVAREYAEGRMAGVAVSYPEEREKHRAAAAVRDSPVDGAAAQRVEEDRQRLEAQAAAAGDAGPPIGFVGGRIAARTRVRTTPERRALEMGEELPVGTPVWIAPRPYSAWREIWRPGLRTCWVEDADVARISRSGGSGPEQAAAGGR